MPPTTHPHPRRVTVVVITFNSRAIIDDCLTSVAPAFPGHELRVVVADSGSTDDTVRRVREHHTDATVVELGDNKGFGAGINAGAALSDPDDHLLVLNPDIRLAPGSGLQLLDTLTHAGVGIAVPRLVDEHGTLQLSLRRTPTLARTAGTALLGGARSERHPRWSEVVADAAAYEGPTRADWATGAALLISARCRAVVGAWDESYFLYSEETDYCLRAADAGFAVELSPAATAIHLGGESQTSPELWSVVMRNKVALYRRRHTALPSAAMWAIAFAGEAARSVTGSRRSRAAAAELSSPTPRHPRVRAARRSAPGWVCFAGQDWWYHNHGHSDFQLMTRIAKDHTVLFVNSIGMRMPAPGRSPQFMRRLARKARSTLKGLRRPLPDRPRFYVLSPIIVPFYGNALARRLNRVLVRVQVRLVAKLLGIRDGVFMVTIPTAWEVIERLPRRALIFNRSDKHSAFGEVDTAYIESLEHRLLTESDSVVYVSHALMQEDHELVGERQYFLDHGVDLDHFTPRGTEDEPADLSAIAHPRIGFFGGIDDYVVDLSLLAATAKRFPDASLVLIGDATCPLDELRALPNVHLLGARPYSTIPAYGSGFDVALMPWLDNDWIAACNPIKLKEYLALGLPVVTTWYPEVARYQHLLSVARGHEEFLDAVEQVLAGRRPASPEECRAAVLDASWDSRAAALVSLVEGPR